MIFDSKLDEELLETELEEALAISVVSMTAILIDDYEDDLLTNLQFYDKKIYRDFEFTARFVNILSRRLIDKIF